MPNIYKSRHANLDVKVRSQLDRRHPTTGDVIETTGAIRAVFGVPGPTVNFRNPLTGEMDTLETMRGGVYDLDAVAEDQEWDDDIKAMVQRRLDRLCHDRPDMIEKVDYVVAPAPKPWPTYDDLADPTETAEMAAKAGLLEKTIAYEKENRQRAALLALLASKLAETPDPEPDPEPVVAVDPPKPAEQQKRLIVA